MGENVERATCVAVGLNGQRCRIRSGLCPGCGCCLWHCEHRRPEAAAARKRGAKATASVTASRSVARGRVRVLPDDQLPTSGPPANLDDLCAWASWLSVEIATGRVDAITGREVCRALGVLRGGLEKRDIAATQKRHAKLLKQLQRGMNRKGVKE